MTDKEITVKVRMSFSVSPDCGVEIPSLDGTVHLMPVAVQSNDAYSVVSVILEHWKKSLAIGGDVQEIAGPALAQAIDAARKSLGIEGQALVSK